MDGCDSKATRCATCPRACTWLLCLTSQVTAPQIGGAHTAFLTQGPWLDGGSTYRHLELQAVAPFPGLAQLTCPGPAQPDRTVHPQLEAQPRTPAPWAPRAPDPSCSRGTSPPRTSDLCVLPVGASPWRGPNAPGQPASQNSPPSCLPLGAEDGHQPRSGPWGTRAPLPRPGLPWGVSPSLPPPGRRGRFSASPVPRRQQVPPVTWKWPFSRAHPHGHLALGSPLHNEIQRSEHSSRFRTY